MSDLYGLLPRRRRCGICRQIGCRADRCPEAQTMKPEPPVDLVDEALVEIAELRERLDALAIETGEYEQVITTLDERVRNNRAEIVRLTQRIAHLRQRR